MNTYFLKRIRLIYIVQLLFFVSLYFGYIGFGISMTKWWESLDQSFLLTERMRSDLVAYLQSEVESQNKEIADLRKEIMEVTNAGKACKAVKGFSE